MTARLHARLAAAAAAEGILDVAYRTVDTPLGTLLLAATEQGLVRVAYPNQGHDAALAQLAELVSPRILNAPGRLDGVARQLDEYFAHRRRAFDVPVDLRLSRGFRHSVLDAPAADPLRGDGKLRPGGGGHRPPARGPRGRQRVRHQPGADRGALPPGGALRRLARRLRRRPGRQAVAADAGGGVMTTATATGHLRQTDSGRGLGRRGARARRLWLRAAAPAADAGRVRADRRALRPARALPRHDRHGAPPVRGGPVPLLRGAVPRAGRRAAARPVRAAAADRPRLVRAARPPAGVAGHARRVAGGLPRRRAEQAHADPAALRDRAAGTRCTATCTGTRCSRSRS